MKDKNIGAAVKAFFKSPRVLLLAIIILAIGSPLLLYSSFTLAGDFSTIRSNEKIQAEITSIDKSEGGAVRYSYGYNIKGQAYTNSVSAKKISGSPSIGTKITIYINPENPAESHVIKLMAARIWMLVGGGIITTIGAFFVVIYVLNKREEAKSGEVFRKK